MHIWLRNPKAQFDKFFAILFGPPSVGKGASGKRIKEEIPNSIVISTGNLVRERLKRERKFRNEIGPIIAAGNNVADEIIMPMGIEAIKEAKDVGHKLIILDGIPRNPAQFCQMVHDGIIYPSNTQLIMIDASEDTCVERACHPSARTYRSGRTDTDRVRDRYNIHYEHHSGMIASAKKYGFHPFFVNGNMPLEKVTALVTIEAKKLLDRTWKPAPPKRRSEVDTTSAIPFTPAMA